jgi:hypothetical protein
MYDGRFARILESGNITERILVSTALNLGADTAEPALAAAPGE